MQRRLSKQKQVPLSLLYLPDELLLEVIEELDRNDLYALSIQCRRLQRLCLPPYLLFLGITTPLIFPIGHLIFTGEQLYAPGVPLTFFAKNVRKFSCDITRPFRFSLALERLGRMLINMEGLEDFVLHFQNWNIQPLVHWDCGHLSPNNQFLSDVVEDSLAAAAKRLSETNIRLRLDILPSRIWASLRSPTLVLSGALGHVLKHVREIAFSAEVLAPSPADLPNWLSAFPLLEHIEFLNPRVGHDQEIKMSMLRCIGAKCPQIRSVRIGEDSRDISAWLVLDDC